MKNFFIKYKTYILSYLACVALGTLCHFIYDWTNHFALLKPFVSIDESLFEHLKLIFYPMILVALIEGFIIKKSPSNIILVRSIGAVLSCIGLSIFHLTYRMFNNNESIPLIDITSYYVFVLIAYLISIKIEKHIENRNFRIFAYFILFLTVILFSVFTEYKPNNVFFK